MHFRMVGGAGDAFPDGRRGRRCISDWSEGTRMHFRMIGGAEDVFPDGRRGRRRIPG